MVTLKLEATLEDADGNPLSNKPIDFYYSYDGETYTLITTENTDTEGKASTTHETTQTTYYKAVFQGDETYDASEDVEIYAFGLIPDAEVILFNSNHIFHGHTDENGKVTFSGVPRGDYTLVVVKDGYVHYKATISITEDTTQIIYLTKIT